MHHAPCEGQLAQLGSGVGEGDGGWRKLGHLQELRFRANRLLHGGGSKGPQHLSQETELGGLQAPGAGPPRSPLGHPCGQRKHWWERKTRTRFTSPHTGGVHTCVALLAGHQGLAGHRRRPSVVEAMRVPGMCVSGLQVLSA